MSNHDKLREAIKNVRGALALNLLPIWHGKPNGFSLMSAEDMKALVDAAESTIPKTKIVDVVYSVAMPMDEKTGKRDPGRTPVFKEGDVAICHAGNGYWHKILLTGKLEVRA